LRINLSDILNRVLNESVTPNEVVPVINNKNYVDLNYVDEDGSAVGPRLVQAYAYGRSMAGNPVVRVYQVSGDSLRKREWKTLRLDRIISWKPRKQTFSKPAPGFNFEGDDSMETVMALADFGGGQPSSLDMQRQITQDIQNAPKIASKNKLGPIPYASQQRKKNVFTSQPNSQKYQMYQKNIADTENDFDRFSDDIWAKAEAEKQQQDADRMMKSVPMPDKKKQGPLVNKEKEENEL